jgi:hypothetical protein
MGVEVCTIGVVADDIFNSCLHHLCCELSASSFAVCSHCLSKTLRRSWTLFWTLCLGAAWSRRARAGSCSWQTRRYVLHSTYASLQTLVKAVHKQAPPRRLDSTSLSISKALFGCRTLHHYTY